MKTPPHIEVRVLALLSRGDSYQTIRKHLKDEFGQAVSLATITMIKRRNEENLSLIKNSLIAHEQATAEDLLDKSRRVLNKQLSNAESAYEKLEEYQQLFDDGAINESELIAMRSTVKLPTVTEMVSVSREMFQQSRVEAGKPTVITNPEDAKQKLKELQGILEENDEITLERIVFAKREQDSKLLHPDSNSGK